MTDFNILYGRSTELFINGQINPNLIIEEGCWYMCIDTAELFIGVATEAGLTLKRINEAKINEIPVENLALKSDVENVKQEVIQTITPEVVEVKTKIEEILIPKVEEEIVPTIDDLKTWVENKEYLQDIDLEGYVTTEKVTEVVAQKVNTVVTEQIETKVVEVIQDKIDAGEVAVKQAESVAYGTF